MNHIYLTRFDIHSTLPGGYASRVHSKFMATLDAMTEPTKKALVKTYTEQYNKDGWHVTNVDVYTAVISGGENE